MGRGGSVSVIKVGFGYRLFLKSGRFFGFGWWNNQHFRLLRIACRSICSISMLKQRLLSIVVSTEFVTTKLIGDCNCLTQLLYSVIMVGLGPLWACCLKAHIHVYPKFLTEPDSISRSKYASEINEKLLQHPPINQPIINRNGIVCKFVVKTKSDQQHCCHQTILNTYSVISYSIIPVL